jgi:hypothetical protein
MSRNPMTSRLSATFRATRTPFLAVPLCLALVDTALAAEPDGKGPWADQVVSSQTGLTKSGKPVSDDRNDPRLALGPSEETTAPKTFFSLGLGGQLVLRFENAICNGPGNDLEIREATGEPYPAETADIYVSNDGAAFVKAGSVSKDGQLSLPANMPVARYVKVVDTSNAAIFPSDADGYDVDGVRAMNRCGAPSCSGVTADVQSLWPPNHKLQLVTLSGAKDASGQPIPLTVTGVTQDEPLDGLGDGDTSPDAQAGTAPGSVFLRAERSGTGDGRVYRIAYTATDANGESCSGTAAIGVPKDMGKGSTPVDSKLVVNSFGK